MLCVRHVSADFFFFLNEQFFERFELKIHDLFMKKEDDFPTIELDRYNISKRGKKEREETSAPRHVDPETPERSPGVF